MAYDGTKAQHSGTSINLRQIVAALRAYDIGIDKRVWHLACLMAANSGDSELSDADNRKLRAAEKSKKSLDVVMADQRLREIVRRFHERAEQEVDQKGRERLGLPPDCKRLLDVMADTFLEMAACALRRYERSFRSCIGDRWQQCRILRPFFTWVVTGEGEGYVLGELQQARLLLDNPRTCEKWLKTAHEECLIEYGVAGLTQLIDFKDPAVPFPNPSAPISKKEAADAWGGSMTTKVLNRAIETGELRAKRITRQRWIFCRDDAPKLPER